MMSKHHHDSSSPGAGSHHGPSRTVFLRQTTTAVKGHTRDNVHLTFKHKKLLSGISHRVLAEVLDKMSDGHRLAVLVDRWYRERMPPLVREQHLQSATTHSSVSDR